MITSVAATRWVSVEGPNSVGKTHLTRALAVRLGPRCHVLAELTDAEGEHIPAQVIVLCPPASRSCAPVTRSPRPSR